MRWLNASSRVKSFVLCVRRVPCPRALCYVFLSTVNKDSDELLSFHVSGAMRIRMILFCDATVMACREDLFRWSLRRNYVSLLYLQPLLHKLQTVPSSEHIGSRHHLPPRSFRCKSSCWWYSQTRCAPICQLCGWHVRWEHPPGSCHSNAMQLNRCAFRVQRLDRRSLPAPPPANER